jgi:formate/nitrite transporter FocA (FNT family)
LGLVILGNLIGGILFTLFISLLAPQNLFTHETMVKIGSHVVDYDAWVLFLCNSCWLANGFIELVNKQRQNSLTRIFLIL